MKRARTCMLILFLALLLCACGGEQKPAMYIEPAQLTEEETDIVNLLGINQGQRIFDFKVDETVQVMNISVYELVDGQWDAFIGGHGGRVFTDSKGRIALTFDHLGDGIREALQSENYSGSTAMDIIRDPDPEGTSWATSLLSRQEEIRYEEEIPLAIQIVTNKNEIRSFDTSYFFHPEEYEQYGYDHVYAVTVLFSQKPLS